MSDFDNFLSDLAHQVAALATGDLAQFKTQILDDSKAFAVAQKANLQRWAGLLAGGQINEAEFKSLVQGSKDLLEMRAQAYVGIAKARLDQLKNDVIQTVAKAAVGILV